MRPDVADNDLMESFAEHVPGRAAEWGRVALGLVLRSLMTIVGYAFGGLVLFAVVTGVTEMAFVDGGWIRALYLPYVLLGALAGASLGLAKAMRREARLLTVQSTGALAALVDRAVGEMAIPEEGIEVDRLRTYVLFEDVAPSSGGVLTRMFTGFAVARALEQAGVRALRDQMLRVVLEAEARGDTVVSQEAVREAARTGISAGFAEQLDVAWQANQGFSRVTSALMLLSLPVLALLFG